MLCYETIVANMREKVSHQSINIPAELLHNPIDLMNRQLTIMKKIYDWNWKVDNILELEKFDEFAKSELLSEAESIEKVARAVPMIGTDGSLVFSVADLAYLKQLLIHAAITYIRQWKEKASEGKYSPPRCPFHGYVFNDLNDSQLNKKCEELNCLFPKIFLFVKDEVKS